MASIPIVDTIDKRIGIISAVALMIITFVVLWFLTYDIPNPLPTIREVPAVAMVDEIVLKELVIEGGAGGGTPSNSDTKEPKPVKQQSITSNKPAQTSTQTGGEGTTTNSQNTQNSESGGNQSNNPFGDGGSGGGSGGGDGGGFGQDSGEGTGTGNGIGFGKGRTRLNNVDVHNISIETDASIYYKLTVDSKGNVVAFSHLAAKTTTTNSILINKIGREIKRQVKYNEAKGAPLEYQFYTIHVKAT
ncbi:MAG: hypothetical protein P8P74_18165 [Crocinitomicaceae bacterium]|nr:hypothetical protein [Crocinitomicaceae bacterium]